jgi:hypothetical protein
MSASTIAAIEVTAADLALRSVTFASLADAEHAIATAWAHRPARDPWTERRVRYTITWRDGWRFGGMVDLQRAHTAQPGFLRTHLEHAGRTMSRPSRPADVAAAGAALLARLAADAVPQVRNAVYAPPPLARVEILWSENRLLDKPQVYRSLAAADVALARAFAVEPPNPGGGYRKTAFRLVWVDGQAHEGRADVRAIDLVTSVAAGGLLRQHLIIVATWLAKNAATSDQIPVDERADKAAWGVELLRRVDAAPRPSVKDLVLTAPPRRRGKLGSPRVEVTRSTSPVVLLGHYATLEAADAMLARAFPTVPSLIDGIAPSITAEVIWPDGYRADTQHFVTRERLDGAARDGGLLRHLLLDDAAIRRSGKGWISRSEAESREREGLAWAVYARLGVDPDVRNQRVTDHTLLPIGTTTSIPGVSLLPDPHAAVAALEAHFARVRPAVAVPGDPARTVPATTNRDVTQAANWLSLALAHDLPALRDRGGRPPGAVWDRWRRVIGDIGRQLGTDADGTYRDCPGFWDVQAPTLAAAVARAVDGTGSAA